MSSEKQIYLIPKSYKPRNGVWEHKHPQPGADIIHFRQNTQDSIKGAYSGSSGWRYIDYRSDTTGKVAYSLRNSIDLHKRYKKDGQWYYGREEHDSSNKGSFGAKAGYFTFSENGRIDATSVQDAFTITCVDDTLHYSTFNFFDFTGQLSDDSTSFHYDMNSYLHNVVGFHFKYSNAGAHSKDVCAFPRRVLLCYARETQTGGPNPLDTTNTKLVAIEPNLNLSGPNLGSTVANPPGNQEHNYNYVLSEGQWDLYQDRLGNAQQQYREKYRFIGPAFEFQFQKKKTSTVTMSCKIWDFKPIISDNYKLSHGTGIKDYQVIHPAHDSHWTYHFWTSNRNDGRGLTKE